MSAVIQSVAGSRIYIGGVVTYQSVVQASDFTSQSWKEIDGWVTSGDLGAEQEMQTQALINRNIMAYSKGMISFPIMANTFSPIPNDSGQAAFFAAQKSCKPYAFRVAWGADCAEVSTVTMAAATPGRVAWATHGLADDTPVTFSSTGTLPSEITAGTVYYVAASPASTTGEFSVSATPGGAAIDFTGAPTGTITASATPVGETDLFYGLALRGLKTGGDASANRLLNLPIQPISEAVTV